MAVNRIKVDYLSAVWKVNDFIRSEVIPVFSSRVLGVLGLLMISTRWGRTRATYGCISTPTTTHDLELTITSLQIHLISMSNKPSYSMTLNLWCHCDSVNQCDDPHPSACRSLRWPRWRYYTPRWTQGSGSSPGLAWTPLNTHSFKDYFIWIS